MKKRHTVERRMIPLILLLSVALLALACVTTTGVETPMTAYPDSSFQAVVSVQVDDDGATSWGYLGLVVPVGWEAGNVSYTGPSQGTMSPSSIFEGFECSPWDHWLGFQSDTTCAGEIGALYQITVTVYTDMLLGEVDISFLAAVDNDGLCWNGDPCTTTVEVIGLEFEQTTWGSVKSEFYSGGE